MDTRPPFLSIQQAADELGLSEGKVRELIRAGHLPALFAHDMRSVRIPRTALFPEESVTRDLTVKRFRRLHLASQTARKQALIKLREFEAAMAEWERAEDAIDAEFLLTEIDGDTRRTA